ncbi:Saccharopine dehydrogenase-like oxidoreductase [Wickerhamiella sorbophila]|uniref:Saccharopine dehydrogenase-like oxidoreductase n=1 Tax=Wickerhamiella sorbophila TaxID=45607 RepID=A0A2T0FQ43_9ASCO|nr:Saccharopine dehydrogenase-like oxidoreductase [Wickerhamiella sorbophila]PRT57116.1 Saccharopine dehydrogenase-like oxidoreductase [Wickerhamiella sorbophila]
MSKHELLVYGAYGYTGNLICQHLESLGEQFIVAGRDEAKTQALAKQYNRPAKVFSLDNRKATVEALKDVSVVLHCAGPYSATSKPMVDACIEAKAHYLDITGEYKVIEAVAARDSELRSAGILGMPSVGMDVVPSDCIAVYVAEKLPSATDLKIFIHATGAPSPGTLKTSLEQAGQPSKIRKNGKIVDVRFGSMIEKVTFPDNSQKTLVNMPWGDIASAYYSTKIPNISVYMNVVTPMMARMSYYTGPLLRTSLAQAALRGMVNCFVTGSDETQRDSTSSEFIAIASDDKGNERKAYLKVKNGYAFTVLSAVEIALRVMKGDFKPGFYSPATLYGADLVLDISGSERKDL